MTSADGSASDETIAYTAVRRVQDRYADIVTRRAWPELAEIMRADCTITVDLLDRGSIDFVGPAAIGDFIGTQLEQFDFFEFVIMLHGYGLLRLPLSETGRLYDRHLRKQSARRRALWMAPWRPAFSSTSSSRSI